MANTWPRMKAVRWSRGGLVLSPSPAHRSGALSRGPGMARGPSSTLRRIQAGLGSRRTASVSRAQREVSGATSREYALLEAKVSSVFRVSDAQKLQLTDEWGEGEKALVAFGRSFG